MATRIFLSFAQEDLAMVNLFRAQTKSKFCDCSAKESYASTSVPYIRGKIRKNIMRASVTLCLIGRTTHASKWVDWEIRTSSEYCKRIYGVRLNSNSVDAVPEALKDLRVQILPWDIEKIARLIRRERKADASCRLTSRPLTRGVVP